GLDRGALVRGALVLVRVGRPARRVPRGRAASDRAHAVSVPDLLPREPLAGPGRPVRARAARARRLGLARMAAAAAPVAPRPGAVLGDGQLTCGATSRFWRPSGVRRSPPSSST